MFNTVYEGDCLACDLIFACTADANRSSTSSHNLVLLEHIDLHKDRRYSMYGADAEPCIFAIQTDVLFLAKKVRQLFS